MMYCARINVVRCRCEGNSSINKVGGTPRYERPMNRRVQLGGCSLLVSSLIYNTQAFALGFQKELKKKKIPLSDYEIFEEDGVKYYDLVSGKGASIERGDQVQVHFDCKFKGIDAVSSRAARLLGGNRTIAEPYSFVVGEEVDSVYLKSGDNSGALFTGVAGPQPPPVLSTSVIGMKQGGKRSIIVPPELGYGDKGMLEIPPNATFELIVEILDVINK
eukprot:TRINITY_DN19935_c0_g1_i1.p3 TRINITY_DN19935_c0_g1~~TRINITY_DN19935_c0_g1_i1.p3  ORF type:complete len:218 (-),score=29.55 TRINITY_DN19935_c0_g1_i1:448-1101(-)